jgi:hypothetical protein
MRMVQRPRREVGPVFKPLIAVFFRYSPHRDAYVLRAVGSRHGPVVRVREDHLPRAPHAVP